MKTSAEATSSKPMGLLEWLRAFRRRSVNSFGRRLIRGASDFLASQSLVGDPPIFDNALFSQQVAELEKNWRIIRQELDEVLEQRESIPGFEEISPDQTKIAKDRQWKTFFFHGFGYRVDPNCSKCPSTAQILERLPNMKTAWFSILSPQYHIPAHRGVTKGLVRIHLGLRVPADRENCFIRVGDKVRRWKEGKCFIIDDTYDHEVFNNTDEERTALVLDVERPLKWRGKIFSELFLWAICKTAYVQDGLKNLEKWEKRIDSTSPNAETL